MILQDHKYKIFFLISSGVGVVLNIIAKSVYPIYDDKLIFPITEHVFPAFVRGDLWSSDLFNLLTDINKQVSALLFFIVFCVLCYVFKKQDKTQN